MINDTIFLEDVNSIIQNVFFKPRDYFNPFKTGCPGNSLLPGGGGQCVPPALAPGS